MDLIIFNPPRYRSGMHHKFNNAVLWLASYLRQRNVDVRIVPLRDENYEEVVREEIGRYKPKFAAVSCKWWDTLYSSSYIASLIKQCDPHVVTVAGGHTASFFAKEIVDNTDFDVVIRGDGEEPLYRLVTDQPPLNCVFKGNGNGQLIPVHKQYVQTQDHLKDIVLVDEIEEIVPDIDVLNSYIWTGKGCTETCLYCAANAWNNVLSFGRARIIYRPVELIVREIEILSKYPGSSRITFDFDPIRGKLEEDYYFRLITALEKKKYNCYFCSWSLPSKELVNLLAQSFNFVELCIDVQVAPERLRRVLGDKRFLKPFFSDEALDDVLGHCQQYDNLTIDLSTLMGLPCETEEDIAGIRSFSDYFYDKFESVRYPYVSPMNVEPGALLMHSPEKYGMVLFRKNFQDFYVYTKRSFENNVNCYQPSSYGDGIYHPLGCATVEDYERGNVFRVYETWKLVQENVDHRSEERTLYRARKYHKYGLLKAGIQGGIDAPTLGKAEVE
jgi:radical SAM superfamily enzyme YgiQ (UPF0313 family)